MMKYRLKDKYTQRRLDEISSGDFTERLQESVSGVAPCVVVSFGKYPGEEKRLRFMAAFEHKEVEAIPAIYDPTIWNEWPGVEPPKDIPLQVELVLYGNKPSEQNRKRDCLTWDKTLECFINDNRTAYFPHQIEKMYFRPWMAPDEEDEE